MPALTRSRRPLVTVPCLLALVGCAGAPAVDARKAEVVVTVRFKSRFEAAEILRRYPHRMPEFRKLDGLLQKYYLYDAAADEWAGIYFWDSPASAQAYMQSDLRKSIPDAYDVVGTPRVELFEVVDVLR